MVSGGGAKVLGSRERLYSIQSLLEQQCKHGDKQKTT